MKKYRNIIALLTAVVLMAGLVLNFNACTSDSPTQSTSQVAEDPGTPFTPLKVLHPRLNKEFEQSMWIGSYGGSITVGDSTHGISKLIVPQGAIKNWYWYRITFWWESTGFLQGGAEFSPHGLIFKKQIRLEISYKDADLTGVNEDDLKIYYYDEDTGDWEIIGDYVDKTRQMVIGYTTHFSRYAIGVE
jgi:hypothetical protein